MSRNLSFRSRVPGRRAIFRPAVEQLESRLVPGDMLGLSGTALWALSLAQSRAEAGTADLTLVAPAPSHHLAAEDTTAAGSQGFVLDVSTQAHTGTTDSEATAAQTADQTLARGLQDPFATMDLDGLDGL